MQTPISIPAIEAEYITPLQAPLTELQFNAILYAISSGLDSLMITDQFTIKASDMFELLDITEQFYNSAISSYMFGMNMDCSHPILSYEEYVKYWGDYYKPLSKEEFDKLTKVLNELIEKRDLSGDEFAVQAIIRSNITCECYVQVINKNTPISLWVTETRDRGGDEKESKDLLIMDYEDYIETCNYRLSKYREQFKVN